MKIEVKGEGSKIEYILVVSKEEKTECFTCKSVKILFYCTQDKKLYCENCVHRNKACHGTTNHDDFKITSIRAE